MSNKKYIKLPEVSNQVVRKKYYTSESVRHPAKAYIPMMIYILKKFVKDGDIVLDPMCGIGTTLIEGMRLFPNSFFVGVELEDKFVKMTQDNIKKVEGLAKEDMFLETGKSMVIKGDARNLQALLKDKVNKIISSPPYSGVMDTKRHTDSGICGRDPKMVKMRYADKIISSPPYSETIRGEKEGPGATAKVKRWADLMEERDKLLNRNWGKDRHTEGRLKAIETMISGYGTNKENIGNLKHGDIDKIVSSPPYGEGLGHAHGTKVKSKLSLLAREKGMNIGEYSKEKDGNIGDLPHGEISKIISSPPFGGQVQHKTNYLGKQKKESGFEYSDNPENIGNLPQGEISKIITSPPFGPALSGRELKNKGHRGKHGEMKEVAERSYMPENAGEDKNNIDRLPYTDKIISSPPYEHQVHESIGGIVGREKDKASPGSQLGMSNGYSLKNPSNIGNTKGQTYLEAMLLVYKECWKILRFKGLLILITKDFIRDKKRIPLGQDTIKLCELAGFTHLHTYYRKIEHPSFWRILYKKKHPEVEDIDSEDILIFEK